MKFLLLHQTVVEHDAIGRDIQQMYHVLRRSRECLLFCEYSVGLEGIPRADPEHAKAWLADPDCVALYHHSIHWRLGEQLLCGAAGPIIFKYHNITPPNFFAQIPAYWQLCVAGREQTYRYVERFPHARWLADSLFNLQELQIESGIPYRVVPPFLSATGMDGTEPDENKLRTLVADSRLQILFVGRIAPNKGHLFLLDVVDRYRRRYGDEILLHIIGKGDDACRSYYESVQAKVNDLDLAGMVNIVGEVNSAEILSYFLGCDAYVCCSEHEGFCCPIVEAQCLCLPVVARARSAVPETLGAGQILLGEEPGSYADHLHRLRTDAEFRQRVIANGRHNYVERFTDMQIENTFLSALSDFGVLE